MALRGMAPAKKLRTANSSVRVNAISCQISIAAPLGLVGDGIARLDDLNRRLDNGFHAGQGRLVAAG